jgi:hypothetical protein
VNLRETKRKGNVKVTWGKTILFKRLAFSRAKMQSTGQWSSIINVVAEN